MGATIWTGSIQFGNVAVPVKLRSAVIRRGLEFHLLHKQDGERLKQQMVCAYEKKPVPAAEQVKGFRTGERTYVLVTAEELERLTPASGRTIEVREFVRSGEIDPAFFEKTYYLEAAAEGTAYGALAEAMKETGEDGLCAWVMRKRAYFGALHSSGTTLRLGILRYAEQLVPARSLNLEDFQVSEKELDIGVELINRLTVEFKPGKFRDEHLQKVREMIARKARGQKIKLPARARLKGTEGGKLLEALEASLKKTAK